MNHLLNLITIFLFTFSTVSSQQVIFPVTNYSTKDYGRSFNPANTAIIQDIRGVIYAANGFKLLEFDGSKWNSYPINKETWILSLAVDSSGIIYAGSQNEFGMFVPDKQGRLTYISLSDSLDIEDLDFTNVWKVHALSDGVVFQSEEKLFLYRNGKTEVLNPETTFHTSFVVNNKLFVRQRGTGLMELGDKGLMKIEGSQIFDTTGIFLMLPIRSDNKKILIGTQEKGFWLYEPENSSARFQRFNVADIKLLEKGVITGGVISGNGSIAISTMQNGVIVIDSDGKTKAIINKKLGLADNNVKQLLLDKNQNLWLALNNGISRVEINSPLSVYSEKSGITGDVNAIIRFENLLYAGTTTGLFVQEGDNEAEMPFNKVYGITAPVKSLIEVEGKLVVGTEEGIFQISGKNIRKTSNEPSFALFYSPETKLLLSGGRNGLSAYNYNGSFRKNNFIKIEDEDIVGIAGESDRTGSSAEFWLGTRYNGVIRLKIINDLFFISDRYNNSDGLPDGWVIPTILNSKTVFETTSGLFSFTNENIVKESLPDSLKNNSAFNKGYFSEFTEINDSIIKSISFVAGGKDKEWICSDNNLGYLDKRSSMAWVTIPFRGIDAGKIYFIYPEENGICWIGTSDGLIRYDENISKDYSKEYFNLIRKVTFLNNDSAIFLGTNFKTDSGHIKVINDQSPDQKPSLSFRDNSIRFGFSAPFYEYPEKIMYSYKLDGNNPAWTQWTNENFQEYTNLHEGEYTFTVKARNAYGTESKLTQYSFVVLPPWYRSGAAYLSYIIAAIFLLWLSARLYSYRLKRENIRLEGIVTERTEEVVRQKDEILSKNYVLEYQKKEIEDSIRYASRIQSAVIPAEKDCVNLLTESFVFFQPLNIVSGDFYWISHVANRIIFTAADCTGHGVPGAFMSMLGVAFLNEIVNKDKITEPDIILNRLREKVIEALQQQGISGEARDGMDIAIISIDKTDNRLSYAGAYNPLIMIRNNEIYETAGDKMPIGIYENMRPFNKHVIDIVKGDVFYMSSDGYEDQFGGPDGKKFKSKQFKKLLLEIHKHPMKKQKEIIEMSFKEWKGDLPQVDDIVVVGLAIV